MTISPTDVLAELDFAPEIEAQREIAALWADVDPDDMWDDPRKHEIKAWLDAETQYRVVQFERAQYEINQMLAQRMYAEQQYARSLSSWHPDCYCSPGRAEYLVGIFPPETSRLPFDIPAPPSLLSRLVLSAAVLALLVVLAVFL